jgi:hypothetical protein
MDKHMGLRTSFEEVLAPQDGWSALSIAMKKAHRIATKQILTR